MSVGTACRWQAYDAFKATLLADPCLNMTELQTVEATHQEYNHAEFSFNITICAQAPPGKAPALATFATVLRDFGGTVLTSRVLDASGAVVPPEEPQSPPQVGA